MRMRVWSTGLLFGLGVGAAMAQVPAQNQLPAKPAGQMDVMDMGKGKPAVPAGPLKIIFSDKTAEWTPAA